MLLSTTSQEWGEGSLRVLPSAWWVRQLVQTPFRAESGKELARFSLMLAEAR